MNIHEIIQTFAKENGVILGVCDAERLQISDEMDIDICNIPFFNGTFEERINPQLFLDGAKSVIAIVVSYNKKIGFEMDTEIRGKLSIGAVNEDYHIIVKRLLNGLTEELQKHYDFNSKIHVDTGFLIERSFAEKAGIGFFGLNRNLISKSLGSLFNIGLLVTTLEIQPFSTEDLKGINDCGNCLLCEKVCPPKALSNGKFDYEKCISYLTQKKGELTETEMGNLGQRLYGCDECQNICHWNKAVPFVEIEQIDEIMPLLSQFDNMTNKEFKAKYGDTAIGWRGLSTIRRNAQIAKYNMERNGEGL